MNISPDLLGALISVAAVILLALLGAMVRVIVKFTNAENAIKEVGKDLQETRADTKENEANAVRARAAIIEMVNAQDQRLRFMEEYWIKAGLRAWDESRSH